MKKSDFWPLWFLSMIPVLTWTLGLITGWILHG